MSGEWSARSPDFDFVCSNVGHKIRYLPDNTHLVEVTCRVIQRRFLLRPSPRLNQLIVGTLARFQRRHAMRICGFVYLSNHCHLLLRPESVEQLAAFMRDVNSKIAREAGRLHHWRERLWGRRYTDVVTSHEPEAQIGRLRYLLKQGCKERLVASPKHWPGASSIRGLLNGEPIVGLWIDRTRKYRAGRRDQATQEAFFTSIERVELSPLPCWDELAPHARQSSVRAMVREIESEMEGVEVLGKTAVCHQDPHERPSGKARSTAAPRFHAVAPSVRRALEVGYQLVRIAHRKAFEELRAGRRATFPAGCLAPGGFVPLRR